MKCQHCGKDTGKPVLVKTDHGIIMVGSECAKSGITSGKFSKFTDADRVKYALHRMPVRDRQYVKRLHARVENLLTTHPSSSLAHAGTALNEGNIRGADDWLDQAENKSTNKTATEEIGKIRDGLSRLRSRN